MSLGVLDVYPVNATINCFFSTNNAAGAAVAPSSALENADVLIYKDGSATQRSSTAGTTMTSPFDSITGLHLFAVDTSDNTDERMELAGRSGRYAVRGSRLRRSGTRTGRSR